MTIGTRAASPRRPALPLLGMMTALILLVAGCAGTSDEAAAPNGDASGTQDATNDIAPSDSVEPPTEPATTETRFASSNQIADAIEATESTLLFSSNGSGALLDIGLGFALTAGDMIQEALAEQDTEAIDELVDIGLVDRDHFIDEGYLTAEGTVPPGAAQQFATELKRHKDKVEQNVQKEMRKLRREMRATYGAAVSEVALAFVDGRVTAIALFENDQVDWDAKTLCSDQTQDETLAYLGPNYLIASQESDSSMSDRMFMEQVSLRLNDDRGAVEVIDCVHRDLRPPDSDAAGDTKRSAAMPSCEGVYNTREPEQVSRCLYEAWRADDRDAALAVAWPEVVDQLFARTRGDEWTFEGCEGFVCAFTEPPAGEMPGILIEFGVAPDVDENGDGRLYVGTLEILG